MLHKPRCVIAVTSSRYDLTWESQALATLDDLDVELRAGVCPTDDDLIALARDADAILVTSRNRIGRYVLAQLPKCKVISRYAVGLDQIDLDAATEFGVVVTHVPDYCTAEVADHTMALILALNRRVVEFDRDLRAGAWIEHGDLTTQIMRGPIRPLRELTLGIVGLGRIGRAVAARARPFGLTLLAADPYVEPELIRHHGAQPVSLDELLARSDIVSVHCPLTPETRGMINADALARMQPTAVLVNTARGPIVDLDALAAALQDRRIAAAALDVVDPEPLPADSPLYRLENVILTPHAAYYSERSIQVVRAEALNEALRVLRGQRPRTVANPAVLERVTLAPLP